MIKLENVTVSFDEKKVLDNFSYLFPEKGVVLIKGASGSGKTTLGKIILGTLEADDGIVETDGAKFSVVFQEDRLVPTLTALQNVELVSSKSEANERLKEVQLDDSKDKYPFELSGGMKRRVAIAGIIAMRPDVLVLDEPAAGLDPRGRREILGSLRDYADRMNASVILVSHSMEDMAHYCDNVVVMNSAKVYRTGTVDEIFSEADSLISVGLDVPMISRVASELKKRGINLDGRLYTVDGVKDAILRYVKEGKR